MIADDLPTPLTRRRPPPARPSRGDGRLVRAPHRRTAGTTILRAALFMVVLAAAIGSVVTKDMVGRALVLTAPQSADVDYVRRIDAISGQILDNDAAMRAVLTQNNQNLTAEAVTRSVATMRQVLQAILADLTTMRDTHRVPGGFTSSHAKLSAAVTALGQHYEALQRAIAAANPEDQQQALLASQTFDNQYGQALMGFLQEYQQRLTAAGFRLQEAPR